jgi:glycerol 3-phosphatase-2
MTDSLLTGVDLVLADLDGVIYRGPTAIEYAVEGMNRAALTARVAYLTNNASRTDASVAEHLSDLGLRVGEETVRAEDVVTSPQAAIRLLTGLIPAGSTVLVVGGEGLTSELERAGFVVTRSGLDRPAAVVQGFHPTVGWEHLAEAAFTLGGDGGADIPWVATNTDWTIPQARGTAPGNGTLVSAVHTAIGRLPIVAGKPEVAIYEEAFARFGTRQALMVGDRLDTDILGANRAGIPSVLVLTGIDRAKQVLAAAAPERPTYLLDDLRGLHEPYPETIEEPTANGAVITVGTARVRRAAHVLTVEKAGTPLDLLRAGSQAIWRSGLAIYGLEVPPALYGE